MNLNDPYPGKVSQAEDSTWLSQYYTDSKEGPEDSAALHLKDASNEKYEMGGELGTGGMKAVRRAHDCNAGRDVAMALPLSGEGCSGRERVLIREARITAFLEHPNIVPVHEVGLDSAGKPFFTMKLLDGETLHVILKRLHDADPETLVRYPMETLLQVFVGVCNAIGFSHSRGVLHLDLKPANIQMGAFGEVLVLDWGLARVVGAETKVAGARLVLPEWLAEADPPGVVRGTPGFMAPEQARGEPTVLDERTDIYALGALLFALLERRMPEPVKDAGAAGAPVFLQKVPAALKGVVFKAMDRNPQRRYVNVAGLIRDVQAYLSGYATSAQQVSALTLLWLLVKRHKALVSLALVSLAAMASLLTVSYVRIKHSESVALAALARIKIEQESKRRIGIIAAPRLLQQAEDHLKNLRFDEAMQALETAVALDGDLKPALELKGYLHMSRLEFDLAVMVLKRAGITTVNPAGKPLAIGSGTALTIIEKHSDLGRAGDGTASLDQLTVFVKDTWHWGNRIPAAQRAMILAGFFQRYNQRRGPLNPDVELVTAAMNIVNVDSPDYLFRMEKGGEGLKAEFHGHKASSLFPLTGLSLVSLDISGSDVMDLRFLRGMPLVSLDVSGTGVWDFHVFADTPYPVSLRLLGWRTGDFVKLKALPQLERVTVSAKDVANATKALEGMRKPPLVIGE